MSEIFEKTPEQRLREKLEAFPPEFQELVLAYRTTPTPEALEQIVLGVESLSYSLGDRDARKAALDALYNAVKNDTTFSPQQFAAAAKNAQRTF